jgi:flagellar assembly protein FliH
VKSKTGNWQLITGNFFRQLATIMGLIKSNNAPPALQPFSMRDIESQAQAILLRARQQAEQLLAGEQAEALKLKAEAKAAGFVEGRREGMAKGVEEGGRSGHDQALNENRAQLTVLVKNLTASMNELQQSRRQLESQAIHEVVKLAIAIARRVTKRQGMIDPAVLTANINEAMKLVVHSSDVRLAIHPSQKKLLMEELPRLQLSWPNLEHVELIEDADIAPGGCRVFTGQGHIDGDLDVQLDRIIADLLPATPEAGK